MYDTKGGKRMIDREQSGGRVRARGVKALFAFSDAVDGVFHL